MIAIEDSLGVEPQNSTGLLPSYCVETLPIESRCPSTVPPVVTTCTEFDLSSQSAPHFKLSQCFGDCSQAEEATQGNLRTRS